MHLAVEPTTRRGRIRALLDGQNGRSLSPPALQLKAATASCRFEMRSRAKSTHDPYPTGQLEIYEHPPLLFTQHQSAQI